MWKIWAEAYDRSLSPQNRAARGNAHRRVMVRFNDAERSHLTSLCERARALVGMCPRLSATPLRLVGVRQELENGYPHTHGDTICLHYPRFFDLAEKDQLSILVHEWIHVYQRFFPIPLHKYLFEVENMRVVGLRTAHPDSETVRRNPDVNDLIYTTLSKGGRYSLLTLREGAQSLTDSEMRHYDEDNRLVQVSKLVPDNEHPFEWVAYSLTRKIVDNRLDPRIASVYF